MIIWRKKKSIKKKIKHGDFGGPYLGHNKIHLGGDPVIKVSDQEFALSVVSGSSPVIAHMMATEGLHGR